MEFTLTAQKGQNSERGGSSWEKIYQKEVADVYDECYVSYFYTV